MAENIVYIPYGDTEINQNSFLESVANGEIDNYMNTRRWLSLGKHAQENRAKVLLAVLHILNSGVTGAHIVTPEEAAESNGTKNVGQWMIDHEKEIQVPEGLEDIYGEAAYIIQTLMSRAPKKKKEEKELKLFDNSAFQSGLTSYIGNHLYGGRKSSEWINEWTNQDELPKQGLRGTTNRQAAMAKQLAAYKQYVNDHANEYNFEGTPYNSLEEWNTRADRAIAALNNTEWNQEDRDSLNALGLNYNDWFNDSGEDSVSVQGVSMTRNQYLNEYLPALEELKRELDKTAAIEKAKQLAALRANLYDGFRTFDFSKFNGRPLTNKEIENLPKLFAKDKFSGDEASQIVGVFKLAERNNQLVPLSKEEIQRLPSNLQGNRSKYLRKVNGLDGIYYDTLTKLYKKPYKNGISSQSFLGILALNSVEALKEKQKKLSEINMNTAFKDIKEFSPEMKKELEALAWDAASIVNPEALTGSGMAVRAAYLRGLANPNRSTLESILDYSTAGLGGIQFAGDALMTGKLGYKLYQLGKAMGGFSKFAGLLGTVFAGYGALDAKDSIVKMAKEGVDSATPKDLENIAYGLMALIGLKSFAKARNKQTIGKQANPTTTEYNITVKDKNNKTHEIKIDKTTAKEILLVRTLGKKKETVDSEILNMPKIKESIQKYKEANPTKKLEIEGASIVNDSKSAFGISGINKLVTSNPVKNPNAPKYIPVGTKWYNPFGYMAQGNNKWGYYLGGGWQRKAWENAAPEKSSKNFMERVRNFWNPEPKPFNSQKNNSSSVLPNTLINMGREAILQRNVENSLFPSESKMRRESKVPKTDNHGDKSIRGNATVEYEGMKFRYDADYNSYLQFINGKWTAIKGVTSLALFKKHIAEMIKKHHNITSIGDVKGKLTPEQVNKLKELKRKGFLFEEGGRIDKLKIEMAKKYFKI